MAKITQKQWNKMSNQDKYQFLKNGKKKLNSICGIDGSSKVNETKVTRYFNISVSGVTISLNCLTESEAYKQADDNIEQWNTK